jgi:hypothetical protein
MAISQFISTSKRFAARTPDEQSVLQNQISLYAERMAREALQKELLAARKPLPPAPQPMEALRRLDSFIDRTIALVNEVLAPPLPAHGHEWD